jgi:hypothetical protein
MNKNARPSLVFFVLLTFLAGTLAFSGCNQSQEIQTPIEGLFGIKLGEPLPPACAIEYDLGHGNYTVVPPQTNAAFNRYGVTINPTNRLVCEIRADGKENEPATAYDVLTALRQKYGNESSKGNTPREIYTKYPYQVVWRHGDRSLCLSSAFKPYFYLSCTDATNMFYPVKPSADTNGF